MDQSVTDVLDQRPACLDRVFINVPLTMLVEGYLDLFINNRLKPEIGIDGPALDRFDRRTFARVGRAFRRAGLPVTLHGPFADLVVGAQDSRILAATRHRLNRFAAQAPHLEPVGMVLHPAYDHKRYMFYRDHWLEATLESLRPVAETCQRIGARLSLENTFEQTPDIFFEIMPHLPGVGFCLDPGHVAAFSDTPLDGWLSALGAQVTHLHLHDNDGAADNHLPLGQGTIDFAHLFRFLTSTKGPPAPPIVALEPHQEQDVPQMVAVLETMWPSAWR
ncbi:MAG: sugar phosphate isomerase/epimerase [Proteobacteria bacterium]|nr:sugar phosphate isomerase/epimerase [Pseudomonadota bacterium]